MPTSRPRPLRSALALRGVVLVGVAVWACGACDAKRGAEAERPALHAARDFYSTALQSALDRVEQRLVTRGFTPEGERRRGFLVEGTSASAPLSMRSGECSILVLETSGALAEAVLRVHGPDGGELARSAGRGGHAALRFCPPNTGTHYVTFSARRGSGLYCAAAFRGPNGIEMDLAGLFPEPSAADVAP